MWCASTVVHDLHDAGQDLVSRHWHMKTYSLPFNNVESGPVTLPNTTVFPWLLQCWAASGPGSAYPVSIVIVSASDETTSAPNPQPTKLNNMQMETARITIRFFSPSYSLSIHTVRLAQSGRLALAHAQTAGRSISGYRDTAH